LICMLGYPLDVSVEALEREGFSVRCVEVRSKKGVCGGEPRVIRQRETGEVEDGGKPVAELAYAIFKTDCLL